jgi:hypothetical protein
MLSIAVSTLLLAGCAHRATRALDAITGGQDAELIDEITRTRQFVLQHDVAFGPVVRLEPQSQTRDGVRVTARPVRLEAEPWNTWPDGTSRLFNDAIAFGVQIDMHGQGLRWDPAHTQLAVNTSEQVFPPAPSAGDALLHLLWLSRDEARAGLAPDAELRLKSAGPYRDAYLSSIPGSDITGLIVFPAPAAQIFAVTLELRLAVEVSGHRTDDFVFLFE